MNSFSLLMSVYIEKHLEGYSQKYSYHLSTISIYIYLTPTCLYLSSIYIYLYGEIITLFFTAFYVNWILRNIICIIWENKTIKIMEKL